MERKTIIRTVLILVGLAGTIAITLGLTMDFTFLSDDPQYTPDPTYTPPFTTTPPPITDTKNPTIYVTVDGEPLPSSGYLLVASESVELEIEVTDDHLLNAINMENSYVEYRIYRIDDITSTQIQLHSIKLQGSQLKDACGLIAGDYYTRCVIRLDIQMLVGYKCEIYVDAVDYALNMGERKHLSWRYFVPPGELEVTSWIPREQRYLDFLIHVENDVVIKYMDAYFTDAEGNDMKDVDSGELFIIGCEKQDFQWAFTWDTLIFPDGEYSVKCRVRFGETLLELEEWKYEKFYRTGVTFQIVNPELYTSEPSVTAPGFGVGIAFAGLTVISLLLIMRKMTKYHGDDKNKSNNFIKIPK